VGDEVVVDGGVHDVHGPSLAQACYCGTRATCPPSPSSQST
jgi:hypothetical protein